MQETVKDSGVSASGDDALDLRVAGQVAHGFLNVYAGALALDIRARSPDEKFHLNIVKMSGEILSRSATIKAASTMKERISKDAIFLLMQNRKTGSSDLTVGVIGTKNFLKETVLPTNI